MCNPPKIKGDAKEKYFAKHPLIAPGATTIRST
jgi:hypothetical protein